MLHTRWSSRLFLSVIGCCALAGLAGCPSNNNSGSPTPANSGDKTAPSTTATAATEVHMGSFFTAVDYGPYMIAKSKGAFEQALKPLNATVTYTTFQTLPSINESLASDKVDVVFEAEPPAIVGKAAGIDEKITGISCNLTQTILVHANSSITAPGQLRGKKIAVLAGTSSHYGVLKILSKDGVQKSDVSIIDMPPPDAKAAFDTNKVDAWAVWPPFVEQEEIAGTGRSLGGGTAQINSIMAMRGGFLTQNRPLAKAIKGVLEDTKTWMIAHPDDAQQILAKELNLPLPVIQKAWPVHNWKAQLSDDVVTDIQTKADFLKDAGFIRSAVTVKGGLIDTSL